MLWHCGVVDRCRVSICEAVPLVRRVGVVVRGYGGMLGALCLVVVRRDSVVCVVVLAPQVGAILVGW